MNTMIKVCSVMFAVEHWRKGKTTVITAMDTGRLRSVMLHGRWWIAVDDLNDIWGNHAPRKSDYLYVNSAIMPVRMPQKRRQLA